MSGLIKLSRIRWPPVSSALIKEIKCLYGPSVCRQLATLLDIHRISTIQFFVVTGGKKMQEDTDLKDLLDFSLLTVCSLCPYVL